MGVSRAKESPKAKKADSILRDRIRKAVDSADLLQSAMMIADSKDSNGIVPIAAVRHYCDGAGFLQKYFDFIDVKENGGCFYLNFRHFKQLNAHIVNGSPRSELKNVGKKYKTKKELGHSKEGVTITHSGNRDRRGNAWYVRIQIQGVRRYFKLGHSRSAALTLARSMKKDAKAKLPLLEMLRKYEPDNPEIESLEKAENLSAPKSLRSDGDSIARLAQLTATKSAGRKSEVSIMQIVTAYQKGAENRANGLDPKISRRCVNQLRKVITLGLGLKPPRNKTKKEIEAAEKRAFERPVSDLTPMIVDEFMDKMLGTDTDYDYVDEVEILERSQSANSTFRQAKSIFAAKGRKIFRRANLIFDLPREFLDEGFLKVSHGKYSLPEFHRIEGIFKELLTLRESNPSHYLVRLIGLYVNLRPSEIVHLRKDQIQYSGYWKVDIRVRPDFKPKHYHERSIKISAGLAGEILDVCQNNGSVFVLSDTERLEIFRKINPDLRSKFLPEAKRPSYELRKFYASASNFALGIETTHERMGHNDPTTTKDHYIDKDTPQELVDLYDKYAEKLFGDIAFPK